MCLSKMSMRRIDAKIKAGVMMGAIVLALSPMNVFADSSTVQGNGGTISGYTVTTSSTAITNPTYFTASTYIRSSRKASEGALRAKSQMRVGIYSPYDFTIASNWSYNKSENTVAAASTQHNFTNDPGWGGIQASGTGGIFIGGWHDFYAGTAVASTGVRTTSLEALLKRPSERVDSTTGETYRRAIGENGNKGFIKASEEDFIASMPPQEALDFIEKTNGKIQISVYGEDLATVIDTYPVTFSLN